MTWNYRVVSRAIPETSDGAQEQAVEYAIHEAYYEQPDGETPRTITLEPVNVSTYLNDAECPKDALRLVLERMLDALEKPVLDFDDFPRDE